jgi:hypothetical protein
MPRAAAPALFEAVPDSQAQSADAPSGWLAPARFLLFFAWASLAVFHLRFFLLSDSFRLTFIPDDGFYYLLPARNFPHLGFWSFDNGATVTSGFHIGWAYLLALLSLGFRTQEGFFLAALALGALLTHACVAIAAKNLWRNPTGLLVLALLAGSMDACQLSVSLMEWPLVVLMNGIYALALFRSPPKGSLSMLFMLGFLGSQARSDFGLWPACLAAAVCILARDHSGGRLWRSSLAGLGGAVAGVAFLFAHNRLMSGNFLQGSAAIKYFTTRAHGGPNALMSGRTLVHLFTGFYPPALPEGLFPLWVKALFLLLAFGGVFGFMSKILWPKLESSDGDSAVFFLAALLALAGYHLLYCFDGVELWYSANQAIPGALLLFFCLESSPGALKRGMFAVIAALIACNAWRAVSVQGGRRQSNLDARSAGLYLRAHAAELTRGKIGSFNAGLLNYEQGGEIINLDGLINNEVIPYIIGGNIACYLQKKGIAYIADYAVFQPSNRISLGFPDGLLESAILSTRQISDGPKTTESCYLYEIDSKKLAAACMH